MITDPEVAALVADDPVLARAVDAHGPPPDWRRPPGFATLVLQVLEQQVSLGAAAAHFDRLRQTAGGVVMPRSVLALDNAQLRGAGVSRQKARYLRALATAIEESELDLDAVAAADDATARTMLMQVPGIGAWTADVHLLFVLCRPDLFPVGDRALQVGVAELLDLAPTPGPETLGEIAARWSPHRSAAARIVWHAYLSRRGRTM